MAKSRQPKPKKDQQHNASSKYDPKKMSNQARSFREAAQRCEVQVPNADGSFEMPIAPAIVCYAFCAEVSLKAILASENAPAPGHDLLNLFNKVSAARRSELASVLQVEEQAIRSLASACRNAFTEWRYIYESTGTQLDLQFLRQFAIAVSELAERVTSTNTNAPQ